MLENMTPSYLQGQLAAHPWITGGVDLRFSVDHQWYVVEMAELDCSNEFSGCIKSVSPNEILTRDARQLYQESAINDRTKIVDSIAVTRSWVARILDRLIKRFELFDG